MIDKTDDRSANLECCRPEAENLVDGLVLDKVVVSDTFSYDH